MSARQIVHVVLCILFSDTCFLSGCFWWGSKVFWGEFQNHASISVLPCVCAICEGIQGKPTSQKPSKWLQLPTYKSNTVFNTEIVQMIYWMLFSLSQQAEEENEQRKRQEQILMEKLLEQEAMEQEDQKVKCAVCVFTLYLYSPCQESETYT